MTPGSTTSELALVRLFLWLGVGGYLIFVALVFWGFAAGAAKWEVAMDKLVEITTMFAKAVWAVVAYVVARGGLKIADKFKERPSIDEIIREAKAALKKGDPA